MYQTETFTEEKRHVKGVIWMRKIDMDYRNCELSHIYDDIITLMKPSSLDWRKFLQGSEMIRYGKTKIQNI